MLGTGFEDRCLNGRQARLETSPTEEGMNRYRSKTSEHFQTPKPGFIDIAGQIVEINAAGGRGIVEDVASDECYLYISIRQ